MLAPECKQTITGSRADTVTDLIAKSFFANGFKPNLQQTVYLGRQPSRDLPNLGVTLGCDAEGTVRHRIRLVEQTDTSRFEAASVIGIWWVLKR